MQIQLNNQFEHNGMTKYCIDNVIPHTKFLQIGKNKDVEMSDCTHLHYNNGRRMSDNASTVSTNQHSTNNTFSADDSSERVNEGHQSFSAIMYDRWQRSNMVSIPQLDQKDIFE
jgi:hypothetical protein